MTLQELWLLHDILLDSERDWGLDHVLQPSMLESQTSNCAQAHKMIHCWYRSLAAAEFRTEQILYHCELPGSPTSLPEPPSTNDSDPDVFDHRACVDRPKWFLNHNAIMRKRITVSNRSVMARSSAKLRLVTLCISCGTHQNTTTGDGGHPHKRIIHSWTQLTLLVNIMARTTLTQSNLSVSSAVVNLLFSRTSKRARESFATSASAKSQFIAQDWLREKLAIRMPTWTITQYFHENIKLEALPSVKNCVSKTLNDSP